MDKSAWNGADLSGIIDSFLFSPIGAETETGNDGKGSGREKNRGRKRVEGGEGGEQRQIEKENKRRAIAVPLIPGRLSSPAGGAAVDDAGARNIKFNAFLLSGDVAPSFKRNGGRPDTRSRDPALPFASSIENGN